MRFEAAERRALGVRAAGTGTRSPRSRRPLTGGGLPVTIRYGAPLIAVALLAWLSWQAWVGSRAWIVCVDAQGRPVPAVLLEFFELDEAINAPSPTPRLGELRLEDGGSTSVGGELVEGDVLVRATAPGLGATFAHLSAGRTSRVEFGVEAAATGRVVDAAGNPVGGAVVEGYGGGPRGVLLAEATSDERGDFVLAGFSFDPGPDPANLSISGVAALSVRVKAPGYAVEEVRWEPASRSSIEIVLQPTRPITGRVVAPELPSGPPLAVRACSLPGVQATVGDDGSFTLDHVADLMTPRLVVSALPAGYTHRERVVRAGDTGVEIIVEPAAEVSGRVISGHSGRGIAGASVWHDHGPSGREFVETDGDGWFTIGRVPAGSVVLHAGLRVTKFETNREGKQVRNSRFVENRLVVEVASGVAVGGITVELN